MADKQLSFEQMWIELMKVFGNVHRSKYQSNKTLIWVLNNRMSHK
jgi:hypothetical protein